MGKNNQQTMNLFYASSPKAEKPPSPKAQLLPVPEESIYNQGEDLKNTASFKYETQDKLMKSTDPEDADKLKQLISECNDKDLLRQMVAERKKIKEELSEPQELQTMI